MGLREHPSRGESQAVLPYTRSEPRLGERQAVNTSPSRLYQAQGRCQEPGEGCHEMSYSPPQRSGEVRALTASCA